MQVASSAKEVAEHCDIIVAMLADPAAARAVGTEVAAGLSSGKHCRQGPGVQKASLEANLGLVGPAEVSPMLCFDYVQARGTLTCPQ